MRFKYWIYINEAISPNDKEHVLNSKLYTNEKDTTIKSKIDQLLAQLESDPQNYTKGDIFKKIQDIIPISNKKTGIATKKVTEDAFRKNWETRRSTEEELKTYDFYKNEKKSQLQEMMELLRKFIQNNIIKITFENNKPIIIRTTLQGEEKLEAPDFTRFLSNLHGIDSSLNQYKVGKHLFNPILEEKKYENYLTKGDNVWVFRGDTPDLCRTFGKGQEWCISSSTSASHWFSYRIDYHQTQYFVFDFNKDENDPARYVNPGVAPPGRYSEWVDAVNNHSPDPEDPNSAVGINGYTSINQYKQYLVSKGIPLDTWQTTEPDKWEERLAEYNEKNNFSGAKNDSDPRVFPLYLKIVDRMKDRDFDTLNNDEKTEFVMSKFKYLTDEQFYFAKNRVSGYYNSLQLNDKVDFAVITRDMEKIKNLAKNPDLFGNSVCKVFDYASDKKEMAKLLGSDKINNLDASNIEYLFKNNQSQSSVQEMAEIIIQYKTNFSDYEVFNLLNYPSNPHGIAELLGSANINKLSAYNACSLLINASYKKRVKISNQENISAIQEMAKILNSDNINKITNNEFADLLVRAHDKQEMVNIIMQYKTEFSSEDVYNMLNCKSLNKKEIAKDLGEYNINKLNVRRVFEFLLYASNKKEMAEILGEYNINKLCGDSVKMLIKHALNKREMAEILTSKNISKLDDGNVRSLLIAEADEIREIAQIIDQYHTNKTPKIEEMIKPYLKQND